MDMEKQEPSSSSSSKSSNSKSKLNKKLSRTIKDKNCPICLTKIQGNHRPAILTNCMHVFCLCCIVKWAHYKRTCPLCNFEFHSFFFTFSPNSLTFHKRNLPPFCIDYSSSIGPAYGPVYGLGPAQGWNFQRRRDENRQCRSMQRRRYFGQYNSVSSEVDAQRLFQWRISVYKEGLSAVPSPEKDRRILNSQVNRESVLQKIEPWIQRELRAILQDPDPTIIVHVATSLFLKSIEKQAGAPSTSANNEDAFLEPLRRFLNELTNAFWHELRCFAESPYTMHTYDEVVEYRRESR